ncbi:benzyl alcohol O-benzoyltransferase-like [Prosopis cineraria]|uniref:benzyl alcohol O-benzoyltransferase-like n=1 Tax=Prosopis cineraria TaxID=364024 RepID=UPI00241070D0|nr:benzyl alcohol O-benzoyltransferase-like [Prosopis cineraria]XP_054802482.1 benzyl alcohol O-benzoyltransferase-like [Prosopis cineraria]
MAPPAAFSGEVVYTVRRSQPVLVAPAKPTPRELKLLSDIDDQDGLRFQIPMIQFYRHKPSMKGKGPAKLIKDALAQALVFYYPFAGRLREGPGRKLMVDCNGEGVMFIEADADISLNQLGDPLQPPFPYLDDFLYKVPGSEGVVDCPLLIFQVTRLKCGGFILAYRLNHTMSDGAGIVQFLKALAEIIRGANQPSILPVWCRNLLSARDPPKITRTHREYEELPNMYDPIWTQESVVHHSFFFGPNKLQAIHKLFSHNNGQRNTRFEVLTAFLWRCRTKALQLEPHEEVRFMCINSVRGKSSPPLLPLGYYGNAFVYPASVTTVGKLLENSLEYALEIVKKVKSEATIEYVQSVADLMVIKGRPCFAMPGTWLVSDTSRLGFRDVDFGWGKAVYGGPATAGAGPFAGVSYYVACENAKGEEGVVVPFYLPLKTMKRFIQELDNLLGELQQ